MRGVVLNYKASKAEMAAKNCLLWVKIIILYLRLIRRSGGLNKWTPIIHAPSSSFFFFIPSFWIPKNWVFQHTSIEIFFFGFVDFIRAGFFFFISFYFQRMNEFIRFELHAELKHARSFACVFIASHTHSHIISRFNSFRLISQTQT